MGPLRVPLHLYKGPYHGMIVTVTRIPTRYLVVPDGDSMRIEAYVKLDEMDFAYSPYESYQYGRHPEGRADFISACCTLPNYGIEWTKEKHT